MKKSYTIAGVGVCLGRKAGYEALVESIITGVCASGMERADSLSLAVQEAMQHTAQKKLPIVTDAQAPDLGEQMICASFREMLEKATENALLLARRENGWLAMALTQ